MEINNLANKLKASPLFNLSLASRELFHSNFLKWLWENYPQMQLAFKDKISCKIDCAAPKKISREKLNTDLLVELENGHRIVIENKVKSLPRLDQLNEYGSKFSAAKNIDFFLLSLVRPDFDDGSGQINAGGKVWKFISYVELADLLKSYVLEEISDEYHYFLLNDYIDFITLLSSVAGNFVVDWENEADFFKSLQPDLIDIKLNDLGQKIRYAQLAHMVNQELSKKPGMNITNKEWRKASAGEIAIGSSLTRGVGLFDLKYILRERRDEDSSPPVVGVQIQGNDFRVFFELESRPKENSYKVAKKLLEAKAWFSLSQAPELAKINLEYPVRRDKLFNQYGSSFYYRSKRCSRIRPHRLVGVIIEYVEYLESKIDSIAALL